LQRYYGIDLDDATAGGHTPHHIACLVENLPQDSCVSKAYNKDAEWTLERTLLAALVNSLNMLIWGMSDKKSRGQQPRRVGPSYMRLKERKIEAQAMPISELMEKLNRPRG